MGISGSRHCHCTTLPCPVADSSKLIAARACVSSGRAEAASPVAANQLTSRDQLRCRNRGCELELAVAACAVIAQGDVAAGGFEPDQLQCSTGDSSACDKEWTVASGNDAGSACDEPFVKVV